jgi:hypothetical protein
MLTIYPFSEVEFFVVKDNRIIYSTHHHYKKGDMCPSSYSGLSYEFYLQNNPKSSEAVREWIIEYFKENGMHEYLI